MIRRRRFVSLFLLLSCVLAVEALTQEATSVKQFSTMTLEELLNVKVVTATRSEARLSDAPAAMTVITRADIEKYGYRNLAEALARVPEVSVHYQGHNTTADFRGFWANNVARRVLYLLDGQRLNDRFHFGDFEPDVIGDLSDVERIEVIRGPGAALYGSVAVLGVVNIITRKPPEAKASMIDVSVTGDDIASGSFSQKYQANFAHSFSDRVKLTGNVYWFKQDFQYDTRTSGYSRGWSSSAAKDGIGIANVVATSDYYSSVPGSFAGGSTFAGGSHAMPNFTVALTAGAWTLGAFSHTRRASWVWPKDTLTFNNPDNDRSWGTTSFYADWKPKGSLEKWQIAARVSYNINTNREISDFSANDYARDAAGNPTATTLFMRRIAGIHSSNAFISSDGSVYKTGSGIDPALLTDAAARAHGGGGRTNYAGVDKSLGLDLQFTPYASEKLRWTAGGNYENADYVNKQWTSFRDGTFIGWSSFGGILDEGYYFGLWTQGIWTPSPRVTVTAGVRYDHQNVVDVYRQLGGDQLLYRRVGAGTAASPYQYVEFRFQNRKTTDVTPRLALNFRINDGSNLRLIYSEAFRAVPPQEIIRLPADLGDADSEKTRNYEAIYSVGLTDRLSATANVFHMKGNVVYAFNPDLPGFTKGSGWSNTGGSLSLTYVGGGLEAWSNLTLYSLKRATDAFSFVRDYKDPRTPALANMEKPLDSPTTLFKIGGSYRFGKGTTVAAETQYSGAITSIIPVNQNPGDPSPANPSQPNFVLHETPSSFSVDLTARQDLGAWGLRGAFLSLKIRNLLDGDVWGVLNQDQQGWDANTYARPSEIPGFGRALYVRFGYNF